MWKISKISWAVLLFMISSSFPVIAQEISMDGFESTEGWVVNKSDGVGMELSVEPGVTGKAIRIDYDFTKGTGFGGIQKLFPLDLPENFEFTFYLKAASPANNFEVKLIDKTGDNVWWVSNRNYLFPQEWKKIRVKKRHISFAWGPIADQTLKRIDRIEFTIASFVGGKGTVWIDDLKFEPLPPETQSYPAPEIKAASCRKNHGAGLAMDNSDKTWWQSRGKKNQEVILDFKTRREFGGLQIDWEKAFSAKNFDLLLSMDGKTWEKAYAVVSNQGSSSFIRLPEAEARYLKLQLGRSSAGKGFGIRELKVLDISNSMTPNDFLLYAAKNSPPGDYPRYFSEQGVFWTITGVNNDVKEALIGEEGTVEVDKALFSLEPLLKTEGSFYNWSNVQTTQNMGNSKDVNDFDFVPSVTWHTNRFELLTEVATWGEANKNSMLEVGYTLTNGSDKAGDFEFYLLVRPFQVNPYYQFLNFPGGAGKINEIEEVNRRRVSVDDKLLLFQEDFDAFGAVTFDGGNVIDLLRNGYFPEGKSAVDPAGLAQGVVKYTLHLGPGEKKKVLVAVPFHGKKSIEGYLNNGYPFDAFGKSRDFWKKEVGHVRFNLPESANPLLDTYHSNLAYILVNRDRVGIQPGSRSYERSWIRDGALTSSALLKSGIVQEVKDFIDWYAAHQYENGKVPCVVDFRGPDPVPENDSHGELIYLIREYFNFTGDTAFLRSKNGNVLKAVDYIASLVAERSTDHYKYGNDSVRAHYGLVPESISHEGYSAKPMHSYWDNFFTMKGLKDAAEIQKILGEQAAYEKCARLRDTFRENLYNSLELAMKLKHIDYIPGCVELGDFDATSTTIALTPCNELKNLPKPAIFNTFDQYYEFFKNRRDGKLEWVNYTPYENRLIGSFIMLDQPGRARELLEFLLNNQRPQGWHHWAEVVWKDERTPRFIGDMPHTWCGSDFINAFRSMFVYENEFDQSLVLGAALYQEWIDAPDGMSVEHLPTYYGEISYAIQKTGGTYRFSITGDVNLPANGIKIKNFNGSALPRRVTVNGSDISGFSRNEIPVGKVPAVVEIFY